MKTRKQIFQSTALAMAILLAAPVIKAEDTEIYFNTIDGDNTAPVNLVLLLDTSGSMSNTVCVDDACSSKNAKMSELQIALRRVIDTLGSNARIGLGRYNKSNVGGRLVYPVRGLDEVDSDGAVRSSVLRDSGDGFQYSGKAVNLGTNDIPLPNGGADNGRVGFLFEDLDVPRYAKITKAYIEVQSSEYTSDNINIDLAYEDVGSSEPFSVTDIQSRTWVGGYGGPLNTTWGWGELYQIDATKLVQDAVDRASWCGGNDLALSMTNATPGDTTTRLIKAFDDRAGAPPALVVEWDYNVNPATLNAGDPNYNDSLSCGSGIKANIGSPLDDGVEYGSGGVDLEDKYLELRASDFGAGLRFPRLALDGRVALPKPDVIQSAYLYVRGRTNDSYVGGDFVVQGLVNGVDASTTPPTPLYVDEFTTATNNISSRPVSAAKVVHTITGNFRQWHKIDVTTVLQEIISNQYWVKNGDFGLALSLQGTGSQQYQIYASEYGAASAPYIEIQALSAETAAFLPRVRDRLKEKINALTADGGTPTMESYSEMGRYLLGEAPRYAQNYDDSVEYVDPSTKKRYLSPSDRYPFARSCTSNHIITLSDGMPTNDGDHEAVESLTGSRDCTSGASSQDQRSYNCQIQLSTWLFDGTKNGLGQPITTHSIGFDVPPDLQENFRNVARASNGQYASARNAQDLEAVFSEIINSITVENTSLAAPGVAVNQLSRLDFLDQTYFSVFKPDASFSVWEGNMKRYRISSDGAGGVQIYDQRGLQAIDPNTGFFKDTATSWWGTAEDGATVGLGGARNQVTPDTRRLFVATSSPSAGGSTTATTATGSTLTEYTAYDKISKVNLGLPSTASDLQHQQMYAYLMNTWGDPLHSVPILVNYGFSGSFEDAVGNPDQQDNTIFVSTNDGMLHAVDAKTGKEQSAFMPYEILQQTAERYGEPKLLQPDNRRTTYGLDSSWTVWRKGESNASAKAVYAFGGMRRGGKNYYALNYTDRSSPKLMWVAKGGSGSFAEMGQTWSEPTFGFIQVSGNKIPVLVFGGGYSPDDHDDVTTVSSSDKEGNAIYMVNAMTGALIWKVSGGDLKWSIPGSVATIDYNFDGVIDFLYAADLGGQIIRVDLKQNPGSIGDLVQRTEVVAKLGASESSGKLNQRRFYEAPAVQLGYRDGKQSFQIMIGSGYRAHPLDEQTQDRIYAIDDYEPISHIADSYQDQSAVTHGDLLDVTTDYSPSLTGKKGYYIDLDRSVGEKVLSTPSSLFGLAYFTTYVNESDDLNECQSIPGGGRAYIVNAIDGSPAADLNNDGQVDNPNSRYEELGNQGIPPTPQIFIPPSTDDGDDDSGGEDDWMLNADVECPSIEYAVLIGTSIITGNGISSCGVEKRQWRELESEQQAAERLKKYSGAATP
ncbi:PilC/PilY family type IV pilus protein [Alcanivorax nanhaiticus]|nr:PilC/PilY family type IV pilus protein [Alcanivorax nanhaiticus]